MTRSVTTTPSPARAASALRLTSVFRLLAAVPPLALAAGCGTADDAGRTLDVVVRHGVVVDGSGAEPYEADVGVADGRIARVGDLSGWRAATEVDATGLYVAPGFVNIHSHARPDGLGVAANMLTQGVTTEVLNPDGGGPVDVGHQLDTLASLGLAVNAGAFIGFNSVWSDVVGAEDRRPTASEIDEMRAILLEGIEDGAWGVSAGLDYKPAYFATADDVVRVVEVVRGRGMVFSNHERLTPESGFSSRAGIRETLDIAGRAGLRPLVTHMKAQGREQGTAPELLRMMSEGIEPPAAADVYPYLAGQTSLAALLIPGWAQAGGREAMLGRFRDRAARARIAAEADEAMSARFGGPPGVYLPETGEELVEVMEREGVSSGGEAVMRVLERGEERTTAILRFGVDEDVEAILRHPTTSVACDCGATAGEATHPRYFGTYPRVLGRYVRERGVLTWAEAIRKLTALPAATLRIEDRGRIEEGMAADVVVFDPETVIDHATFDDPTAPSEGVRHVLVNGRVALADGEPTGVRAGRALRRASAGTGAVEGR